MNRVTVPVSPDQCDLTQLIFLEIFVACLQKGRSGTLLHTNLEDAFFFARSLYDHRAFLDLQREGLFAIDIFARIDSIQRNGNVPVIWRRNQNGIGFRTLEQRPVIAKLLNVGLFRLLRGFISTIAPDVADGCYAYLRILQKLAHDIFAATAAPDDSEADGIVSAQNTGVGGGCHGDSTGLEELAASKHGRPLRDYNAWLRPAGSKIKEPPEAMPRVAGD